MFKYIRTTDSLQRQEILKEITTSENDVYVNLDYVREQILGAEGTALHAEVYFLFNNLQEIRKKIEVRE